MANKAAPQHGAAAARGSPPAEEQEPLPLREASLPPVSMDVEAVEKPYREQARLGRPLGVVARCESRRQQVHRASGGDGGGVDWP